MFTNKVRYGVMCFDANQLAPAHIDRDLSEMLGKK